VSTDLAYGTDAPLAEIMRTTRAIRRIKPDPVPRDLLEQLVEAATWGPVGGNAQTFSWVVVTDRGQIERLAELWPRVYRLAREIGIAAVPPGADTAKHERIYRATDHLAEHFAQLPAVLVPCYDSSWQPRAIARRRTSLFRTIAATPPRDLARVARHARRAAAMTEAASVYPGVQNLLLTARALGLGATLTTMHLFAESEFKAVLEVPRNVKTYALLPVGWPQGRFGSITRRPVADVIRWNRWS
jgi:nitroreductase